MRQIPPGETNARPETHHLSDFSISYFIHRATSFSTLVFEMEQQKQRRKTERVQFGKGFAMKIIAIDGSWYRTCNILDVSEDGALLQFQQSLIARRIAVMSEHVAVVVFDFRQASGIVILVPLPVSIGVLPSDQVSGKVVSVARCVDVIR